MRTEVEKLPELFLARLEEIFPQKRFHELVNTFAFKKPVSFRINTEKIQRHELSEELSRFRFKAFSVTWFQNAFYTYNELSRLQKLSVYKEGKIYVQRLSSMVPPLVLAPKKTDMVLDMAAAPGSKTLQMSNMMHNQGLITAYDNDEIRIEKLLFNIKMQGATNIVVKLQDATQIWKDYPDYFDKILLDAPCSTESRFYVHDGRTYKHWSEKFIKNQSELQKKLIASALVSLKIGGELVYSTCTYAPEENEGVIDWVIQMAGDRIELIEPHIKLSNIGSPILKWHGNSFAKKVSLARRILPNREMEGFFIAKIRKIKQITV